jgi:hypothetical protein
MLLRETCLFRGARMTIELRADASFRLAYGDEVVYDNASRTIRGKRAPYRFRSVEQLRYDFEQDVRAMGGELG